LIRHLTRSIALLAVTLALLDHSLSASTISYTGNLRTDANVTSCGSGCVLGPSDSNYDYAQYAAFVVPIVVTSTSTLEAVSFSYGGGTNAAGNVIAASGFEPYFSLFGPTGDFIASTYFGTTCPAGANTNPSLGGCYDELLDAGTVAPGTYSLALSAYENLSLAENYGSGTLADGFTGLGNLAPGEDLHYAFDLTLTSSSTPPPPSPVPEPVAEGLVVGFAGLTLKVLQQIRAAKSKA
jgi:hypothetical protein